MCFITFPYAEILLIYRRPRNILNRIEKCFLRSILQLLNYSIYGLSVLKINVIVGVFSLATSMALVFIRIERLYYIIQFFSNKLKKN